MKRLTAILLMTVLMMTFLTGCGKKRELYSKVDLKNYVEVKDYLGIEIDTTSDAFIQYYDATLNSDVETYSLYTEVDDGVVANGYIANIDYVGKIDGVAFDGGTAEGYNLKIGSGTFIDDFEEELIGVAVGETKDLTATFPEDYGKEELNGKEAIFTVTVNYIGRPMTVEEAYAEMDFESAEQYNNDITERASKEYLFTKICEEAKIIDYPAKDLELLGEAIFEHSANYYQTNYNQDFESLLVYNNLTAEQYKKDAATELMSVNMIMYYILDAENLEIYESTVDSQGVDQPVIAESYAVQEIVLEYLYDNAKIK